MNKKIQFKSKNNTMNYLGNPLFKELLKRKDEFNKGDKVKINYNELTKSNSWKKDGYTDKFRQWIEDNKDKTFTLQPADNGVDFSWEFVEDETIPKWHIWYGFLTKQGEVISE